MHSDHTSFTEPTVHCDLTNQAVFDARQCSVPASVLRDAPYSLAQGDAVSPTIRFFNEIGSSDWSDVVLPALQM